jgi:hypothetical protein
MHRREIIMQTIATTLTGLATTGANISRARPYAVSDLPALTIEQASDTVDDGWQLNTTGRVLQVDIIAHAQTVATLETVLNQISTEVFESLRASPTLGLAYCYDTRLLNESGPDIEGAETQQPVGRLTMTWQITYEHSDTSTEA